MERRPAYIALFAAMMLVFSSTASFAWELEDQYFDTDEEVKKLVFGAHDRTRPLSPYSEESSKQTFTISNFQRYQVFGIVIDLADGAFLHISPRTKTGSEHKYEFAILKFGEPMGKGFIRREGKVYHFEVTSKGSEEIRGSLLGVTTTMGLKSKGYMRTGYHLPGGLYLLVFQRCWVKSWFTAAPSDSVDMELTISATTGKDIPER